MFVSESNIFDPGKIKIHVSSMDGKQIELDVSPDINVDHLKIQISSHLYDPVESVKTSLYHRILHVNSGIILDEKKLLSACQLKEGDELLLIRKRIPGPSLEGMESKIREDSRKTPSTDDVSLATQDVPSKNMNRPKVDVLHLMNFKDELRKILISLIDAAQKILCLNPDAAKIFEETEKCPADDSTVISAPGPVDPDLIQPLVNMGFPEQHAKCALLKTNMCTERAIQWMLEHEGEVDLEEPRGTTSDMNEESTSHSAVVARDSLNVPACTVDQQMKQSLHLAQMSGSEKVKKMLEGFRAYRRREFRPNPKALKILVEMGFSEMDAVDALCIHGNKQEEACDWLLSGGHMAQKKTSNLEAGLDPDSPVYRSIMANPVVQLGLSNPKSLLAFLMVLENPNSTQQWINDPDTGPMLIQISRIYHAERHAPTNKSSLSAN